MEEDTGRSRQNDGKGQKKTNPNRKIENKTEEDMTETKR